MVTHLRAPSGSGTTMLLCFVHGSYLLIYHFSWAGRTIHHKSVSCIRVFLGQQALTIKLPCQGRPVLVYQVQVRLQYAIRTPFHNKGDFYAHLQYFQGSEKGPVCPSTQGGAREDGPSKSLVTMISRTLRGRKCGDYLRQ